MENAPKSEYSGKKPTSPQCECYTTEKEYIEALLGYSTLGLIEFIKSMKKNELCEQFEADLLIVLALQAAGARVITDGDSSKLPPIPDKIAWWHKKSNEILAMIQRIETQRNKELH